MLKENRTSVSEAVEFSDIYAPLTDHLSQLDTFLHREVEVNFEKFVSERIKYVLSHQGKRLRPLFAFFSGWKEEKDLFVKPEVVKVAAIVEMIHLASLVHDDILDGATVRHQSASVQSKYGEKEAVLIGDSLFAHAFKLTGDFSNVEICRLAAESVKKICAGEIAQTLEMKGYLSGESAYYQIVDFKTGELFWLACVLGAKVGVGDSHYEKAVGIAGRNFGIAYQMYDDLIDIIGDEGKIGKTLGTDIATGKMTLPLIFLLEALSGDERAKMEFKLKNGGVSRLGLKTKMEACGIIGQMKMAICERLEAAIRGLLGYEGWYGAKCLNRVNSFMINKIFSV